MTGNFQDPLGVSGDEVKVRPMNLCVFLQPHSVTEV